MSKQIAQLEARIAHLERIIGIATRPSAGLNPRPMLFRIARRCSVEFGFSLPELFGRSRQQPVVVARHVFFWLARHHTGASLPQIAEFCGGREHGTVCHGLKHAQDLLDTDPDLARRVTMLADQIRLEAA